jgi:hypothetical protein
MRCNPAWRKRHAHGASALREGGLADIDGRHAADDARDDRQHTSHDRLRQHHGDGLAGGRGGSLR